MSQSNKIQGTSGLDTVLPLLDSLQIDEKLTLLEKLLGRHSGLNVVFTSKPVLVLAQIEQMPREQLGEVLIAVSERIARGG